MAKEEGEREYVMAEVRNKQVGKQGNGKGKKVKKKMIREKEMAPVNCKRRTRGLRRPVVRAAGRVTPPGA